MPTDARPQEGNWYEDDESGDTFMVVTVDEDEGIIEIQHLEGELEEIELDDWQELDLTPIDQPENYLGTMDDDYDEDEIPGAMDDMESEGWGEPLMDFDE